MLVCIKIFIHLALKYTIFYHNNSQCQSENFKISWKLAINSNLFLIYCDIFFLRRTILYVYKFQRTPKVIGSKALNFRINWNHLSQTNKFNFSIIITHNVIWSHILICHKMIRMKRLKSFEERNILINSGLKWMVNYVKKFLPFVCIHIIF